MSPALLDVNVLIALLWPEHQHRNAAKQWFAANRSEGWATCTLTQSGFVRVSSQPKTRTGISIPMAFRMLTAICEAADHHFWPLADSLSELHPEIQRHLYGHRQLTDAILLDLAIRKGGRLVTLDQGVRKLLSTDSPLQASIHVIGETGQGRP